SDKKVERKVRALAHAHTVYFEACAKLLVVGNEPFDSPATEADSLMAFGPRPSRRAPRRGYPLRILPFPPGGGGNLEPSSSARTRPIGRLALQAGLIVVPTHVVYTRRGRFAL